MQNQTLIKSPLNYTGGKFKLLPQILPLFPEKVDCFYDIFCGGGNVVVNVQSQKKFAIDINSKIISLYSYFSKYGSDVLCQKIQEIIDFYGLSVSSKNGYEFYDCNSSVGLGKYNVSAYANLKKNYNDSNFLKFDKELLFYVLIIYGFNNQIRFNKKGEFNIPVGKRDFNDNIKANFIDFVNSINSSEINFKTGNYYDFELDESLNNFVYADPPYLITTATYNEADGWNEVKERELLSFLDSLNKRGIKFALSNVIEHNGQKNDILIDWVKEKLYNTHNLNFSYKNSSYNKHKDTSQKITKEVLITN